MSACSVRLCPSLPCNPLHLSPSSGLLWPPLPCAIPCPSSSFDVEKHKLFGVYGGVIICLPGWHLSPRLGACGRVPGWLVSHFLSFVSKFFSFVSQATSFHLSPTSFHLSPTCFHCLPGWVLVVGFAGSTRPQAEKKWETNDRKWETSRREPNHKHRAWETTERKWETSQLGTRPQAPSLGNK